jgi:hypothetical protein
MLCFIQLASMPENPVLIFLIELNHWPGFSGGNSIGFTLGIRIEVKDCG